MTKVVLLSAKGRMSPPIDMPDHERDVVSLSFVRVVSGEGKILVSVDFLKSNECVPCGDLLVPVYKEAAVTKRTAAE